MFTEDMTVFFDTADFAHVATWSPSDGSEQQTANVILDSPDQELFSGALVSTDYAITYPASEFVGLDHGDLLTIESVEYQVREVRQIEDGRLMRATLGKI